MPLFDASYRQLFSHLGLLQDLLRVALPRELLKELDVAKAFALSPAYIGPALQLRQGDLAWSIPLRHSAEPALLLGIEHQSRPERHMSLRIGTYKHLQLEAFIRQHPSTGLLPLPVMLVLYSGKQAWNAPLRSGHLFFDFSIPWFADHIPQQSYLLIDLKKQSLDQSLQSNNLFALVCRMQHNQGLEHLSQLMQTVLDTCADASLLRDLASWVNQAVLPRCLPNLDIPHHLHVKDIHAMLEDNSDSWLHQWETQGIQKGLAQGISQGISQGRSEGLRKGLRAQQNTLIRQLRHKFGRLPATRKQLIAQATARQIRTWSLRLLDARNLDHVFQSNES